MCPRTPSRTLTRCSVPAAPPRDDIVVLPNGFKLAVRIWGDPKASADAPQHRWLALHGWADNAASFDRLAPLLMREGAGCVVSALGCCLVALQRHESRAKKPPGGRPGRGARTGSVGDVVGEGRAPSNFAERVA